MATLLTTDPFFSSKFSIEWAKNHIKEFELQADKFFREEGCTVFTELDVDRSYQLLKVKFAPQIPHSLLGHATDTAYNLRAALDQAIYSVAQLNNTISLKGFPFFPVTSKSADFEIKLNGVQKFLPREILDLIRKFKPYKGGNDLIWALNDVCNVSKHGLLHSFPATLKYSVVGPRTVPAEPEFFSEPIVDGDKNEVAIARLPISAEHSINTEASFTVGFGNIECIKGQPALAILNEFLNIVEGIVIAIEAESRRLGLI